MAQRRMNSIRVVGTDLFLEMPPSTQNLYFHLGMYADDDGFVSPQKVIRMVGSTADDLKILTAKKFVIPFDSGVLVITHWRENNYLQKDRYVETIYKNEKSRLQCIQNVYILDTQVRLGKVRLELGKVISKGPQTPKKTADELWKEMIEPFLGSEAPATITLFENHWRGKNHGEDKELWQMEKVFDMGRRLDTWKKRGQTIEHKNEARRQLKKVDEMPRGFDRSGSERGLERLKFD